MWSLRAVDLALRDGTVLTEAVGDLHVEAPASIGLGSVDLTGRDRDGEIDAVERQGRSGHR